MTKQEYIEWRRGVAAFKAGVAFSFERPHAWKMGWLNAKQRAEEV